MRYIDCALGESGHEYLHGHRNIVQSHQGVLKSERTMAQSCRQRPAAVYRRVRPVPQLRGDDRWKEVHPRLPVRYPFYALSVYLRAVTFAARISLFRRLQIRGAPFRVYGSDKDVEIGDLVLPELRLLRVMGELRVERRRVKDGEGLARLDQIVIFDF